LLNKYPLSLIQIDIGVISKQKLAIIDKEGRHFDGTDNPDFKEFHVMRIENLVAPQNVMRKILYYSSGFQDWLNANFEHMINQWTIVDVDGYMDGNLLIQD
jgi:hypothetical protein